jgi:hypothetical protein
VSFISCHLRVLVHVYLHLAIYEYSCILFRTFHIYLFTILVIYMYRRIFHRHNSSPNFVHHQHVYIFVLSFLSSTWTCTCTFFHKCDHLHMYNIPNVDHQPCPFFFLILAIYMYICPNFWPFICIFFPTFDHLFKNLPATFDHIII